jgi:signal transduction histidine kinase
VTKLRGFAIIFCCIWGLFSCGNGDGNTIKGIEDSREKGENPSDSSEAVLFLDFEDGEPGNWSVLSSISGWNEGIFVETVPASEYNNSRKVMYFGPEEGEHSGSLNFMLSENGIEPFPLTGDIYLAWSWNISRIEDMNGVWIYLRMQDMRTGKRFVVRAVNHIETMHDCLVTYDPPRCWCYNEWSLYDFVWRRYGPFTRGDIMVNSLGLAVARAEGVEAWVDNIWIGRGEPPGYVNTISDSARIAIDVESEMTEFSYAFLDHDYIPDRVEVYRERADIYINPHISETPETGEVKVRSVRMTPDMTLDLGQQRGDAVVTPADLDGDGYQDLLFQFDDLDGSICFRNQYLKGRFTPVGVGALRSRGEHGSGTAVADIDGDSDLDLFMYNGFRRHGNFGGVRIFRNEGHFQFTDWTEGSYLLSEGSFGGVFADLNGDRHRDLFINYKPFVSGRRRLMVNLNDGTGRFNPSPEALRDPGPIHYNLCKAADFDNDGDLDIYLLPKDNIETGVTERGRIFRNDGGGGFSDLSGISGANHLGRGSGLVTGDFNLDGLVDIYIVSTEGSAPNHEYGGESFLYLNRGGFRFERTERYSYLKIKEAVRALAALDFDLDGDLDIAGLSSKEGEMIIRENIGKPENFLQVRLLGGDGNRQGLGGKVFIYRAGHQGMKEHLIGYREISLEGCRETKVPPVAHFGLGDEKHIDLRVLFPPGRDQRSVEKTLEKVRRGSFLNICRSESFVGKLFCGYRAARIRGSLIYIIFRVPLWFFSLTVFAAILSAGVWIRGTVRPRKTVAAAVSAVAGSLALLLIYRAPLTGAAVSAAALLAVMFSYRLEALLRSMLTSSSRMQKLEELLLDELSQAIHTEKKFAFLGRVTHPDSGLELNGIDGEIRSLHALVSAMRMVSPADPSWRTAREEVARIRQISGRIIEGESENYADIRLFRHSLGRLNSILEDCRTKLRKKYSVNFMDEWDGLKREYSGRLKEEGIELTERFPGELSGRSIHILPGEFRHIFKNLLDNSIYAMKLSPEKKIIFSGRYEAHYLVLNWRDTGPGLPAGMMDELFVSPVQSDKPGGRGEGAYQSRRILDRRGGIIRAEPPPGDAGVNIIMKLVLV